MGDKLTMSSKERQRSVILAQVAAGQMSRRDASKRLSLSARQLRRIIKRYKEAGDAGLIHRSRGRSSSRAIAPALKQKILALYQADYMDFGPTLASEKLAERNGVKVHPETLRLWLKGEGLWQAHRRRKSYRAHRARRPRYGELLQLDGSIHAWFSDSQEKQCLMNMVDDATGKTLALMDFGETTRAAFALLKWWIQQAGIPLAVYVDLKSLYVSPKSLGKEEDKEELVEAEWLTHFSKACKKLGIEVIKAYSPQAKGRVERNHAVYQDRFVKELKLRGINTIEGANELLRGSFVNQLNEKFAKPAACDEDAHVALHGHDLDQILCWEYTRQVKNDWTIQFKNKHYQIERIPGVFVHAKQKIGVRQHLDEHISLWHRGQRLPFHEISPACICEKKTKSQSGYDALKRSKHAKQNKHKSPWAAYQPGLLKSMAAQLADTVA